MYPKKLRARFIKIEIQVFRIGTENGMLVAIYESWYTIATLKLTCRKKRGNIGSRFTYFMSVFDGRIGR